MAADPEELRRYYDNLTDEALLEIAADELTDVARSCYEEELAKRGLAPETTGEAAGEVEPEQNIEAPKEELVALASYADPEEIRLARSLLAEAGIPVYFSNQDKASASWRASIQLLVPASLAEEAREILESPISDEELEAQAEAAGDEPES